MMVPGYVSGVPFLLLFGIGYGVCCLVNKNHRDINKNPPGFLYAMTFCPHQRYFRRVGTRTLILIGFAIWSFIPASSATCLSSENAFAVMATMGIFAF